MTKLTNNEFTTLYKNTKLTFTSYYKYVFTFRGTASDGVEICAQYGGDSDMIYRYEVNTDQISFGRVEDWMDVTATKNDETRFSYYDY